VSTRAIGKYVSTLFADTRDSTRKLIEKHLNDIQLASAPFLLEEGPISGAGQTPTNAGFATSGSRTPSRETPPRSGRRASLTVLMLLVPLAIVVWLQTKRYRDAATSPAVVLPPAVLLAPSVAPPPSSPPAAKQEDQTPRLIHVRIKTSPDGAQLYIDDKRIDSNPYVATVSPDSVPHTIRATLKGFETENKVVLFDNDVDVRLTLSRSKSTSRAPVPRAAASPESRTASSSTAPAPECNPPFTIDIEGIRRMKPECL
jgi:hypothetical protein